MHPQLLPRPTQTKAGTLLYCTEATLIALNSTNITLFVRFIQSRSVNDSPSATSNHLYFQIVTIVENEFAETVEGIVGKRSAVI